MLTKTEVANRISLKKFIYEISMSQEDKKKSVNKKYIGKIKHKLTVRIAIIMSCEIKCCK